METDDGEGELNPLRGPWAALAARADRTPGGQAATRWGRSRASFLDWPLMRSAACTTRCHRGPPCPSSVNAFRLRFTSAPASNSSHAIVGSLSKAAMKSGLSRSMPLAASLRIAATSPVRAAQTRCPCGSFRRSSVDSENARHDAQTAAASRRAALLFMPAASTSVSRFSGLFR